MIIQTRDDWWLAVVTYKDQLIESIKKAHANVPQPTRIVDRDGAKICAEWDDDQKRDLPVLIGQFLGGIDNRDWERVHDVLQTAWQKAPDLPEVHRWPAWHILCDLCSETWVFEEERETCR